MPISNLIFFVFLKIMRKQQLIIYYLKELVALLILLYQSLIALFLKSLSNIMGFLMVFL